MRLKLFFVVVVYLVQPVRSQTIDWHPESHLHLGAGLDRFNPEVSKADPVKVADTDYIDGGGSTVFTMQLIDSAEDIRKALSIDVRLSARYFFASASASTHYESLVKRSQRTVTWAMRGYTDFGRRRPRSTDLTEEASALLKETKYDEFVRRYGTDFVQMERRASWIVFLFQISNVSSELTEKLKTAVSAGGNWIVGGAKISVEHSQLLEEVLRSSTITVTIVTRGGGGLSTLPVVIQNIREIDKIESHIAEYVKTLDKDNAVPVQYFIQSYETLGVPKAVLVGRDIDAALTEIYGRYQDANQVLLRIKEIIDQKDTEYSYVFADEIQTLDAKADNYKDYLKYLRKSAQSLTAGEELGELKKLPPEPVWPRVRITITKADMKDGPMRNPPFLVEGTIEGGHFDQLHYEYRAFPREGEPHLQTERFALAPPDASRVTRFKATVRSESPLLCGLVTPDGSPLGWAVPWGRLILQNGDTLVSSYDLCRSELLQKRSGRSGTRDPSRKPPRHP